MVGIFFEGKGGVKTMLLLSQKMGYGDHNDYDYFTKILKTKALPCSIIPNYKEIQFRVWNIEVTDFD